MSAKATTAVAHEKVRDTILMRFNRRGGPTRSTADFRAFPAEQQREIIVAAKVTAPEIPVLLTCRDDHSWLLITTQRLVWKSTLAVESLKGSALETIISPSKPTDSRKTPLSPNGVPLAIRIADNRGHTHDLPVEVDRTAYGAMHAMLTFVLEAVYLKAVAPKAAKAVLG